MRFKIKATTLNGKTITAFIKASSLNAASANHEMLNNQITDLCLASDDFLDSLEFIRDKEFKKHTTDLVKDRETDRFKGFVVMGSSKLITLK